MAGEDRKERDRRWYFSQSQLINTPSRKSGIDSDRELNYRQQAANFIQDMGQRLQVPQLCINTAIVYMHRFYMFHSFTKFHRNNIAAACLFLAAKVEEQPRKLEHVIKVAHMWRNREAGPLNTKSEAYLEQAQELVVNENILLQTLGFDITVDHPHTHVVKTCQMVRASKDLAQTSYFLATNSLHLTSMCVQFPPQVVACVCIHLACKWSNWEIPRSSEGKEWFQYTGKDVVTAELLEQLTQDFLNVMDKCPSKLKRKILTWKSDKAKESGSEEKPGASTSLAPQPKPKSEPSATISSAAAAASAAASHSGEHGKKEHDKYELEHKERHAGGSATSQPAKPMAAPPSGQGVRPDFRGLTDSGMRRVKTEPSLTSLTPKEYMERKEREKMAAAAAMRAPGSGHPQAQHHGSGSKQPPPQPDQKPRHFLDAIAQEKPREHSGQPNRDRSTGRTRDPSRERREKEGHRDRERSQHRVPGDPAQAHREREAGAPHRERDRHGQPHGPPHKDITHHRDKYGQRPGQGNRPDQHHGREKPSASSHKPPTNERPGAHDIMKAGMAANGNATFAGSHKMADMTAPGPEKQAQPSGYVNAPGSHDLSENASGSLHNPQLLSPKEQALMREVNEQDVLDALKLDSDVPSLQRQRTCSSSSSDAELLARHDITREPLVHLQRVRHPSVSDDKQSTGSTSTTTPVKDEPKKTTPVKEDRKEDLKIRLPLKMNPLTSPKAPETEAKPSIKLKLDLRGSSPGIASVKREESKKTSSPRKESHMKLASPAKESLKMKLDLKAHRSISYDTALAAGSSKGPESEQYRLHNQSSNPLKLVLSKERLTSSQSSSAHSSSSRHKHKHDKHSSHHRHHGDKSSRKRPHSPADAAHKAHTSTTSQQGHVPSKLPRSDSFNQANPALGIPSNDISLQPQRGMNNAWGADSLAHHGLAANGSKTGSPSVPLTPSKESMEKLNQQLSQLIKLQSINVMAQMHGHSVGHMGAEGMGYPPPAPPHPHMGYAPPPPPPQDPPPIPPPPPPE